MVGNYLRLSFWSRASFQPRIGPPKGKLGDIHRKYNYNGYIYQAKQVPLTNRPIFTWKSQPKERRMKSCKKQLNAAVEKGQEESWGVEAAVEKGMLGRGNETIDMIVKQSRF